MTGAEREDLGRREYAGSPISDSKPHSRPGENCGYRSCPMLLRILGFARNVNYVPCNRRRCSRDADPVRLGPDRRGVSIHIWIGGGSRYTRRRGVAAEGMRKWSTARHTPAGLQVAILSGVNAFSAVQDCEMLAINLVGSAFIESQANRN